jgi:hypothetical protein
MALSHQQEQDIHDKRTVLDRLKLAYKAILHIPLEKVDKKNLALIDMLAQLDAWENDVRVKANTELDDSVKVMVYLHEANVYNKIKTYLDRQLS